MKNTTTILFLIFSSFVFGQVDSTNGALVGTVWINNLFDNCTDTLWITSNNDMTFYRCEHEYKKRATYTSNKDTLFIDLYDYKDDNATIGLTSKFIMVIQGQELHYLFIGHLYHGKYKEIEKKYYQTAKYYRKIK